MEKIKLLKDAIEISHDDVIKLLEDNPTSLYLRTKRDTYEYVLDLIQIINGEDKDTE